MIDTEFKERLISINPNIATLEAYCSISTKILCRCITCGNEWKATPAHLLNGRGCPVCSRKRGTSKRTKSHDVFLQEVSSNNPNIKILSRYSGANKKVDCMCLVCGYHWMARAGNLAIGVGCPQCAGNARKTPSAFLKEMQSLHPTIEILSEYSSADEKVICKCSLCTKTWEATPNSLLRGSGCPTCFKRYKTSFAEQALLFYLKKYFPNAINTYTLDSVEFDIFLEENKVAIEYDGYFWHKKRLNHDNLKDQFCVAHGIRLIRIREPGLENTSSAENLFRLNHTDEGLSSCIIQLLLLLGVECPEVNLESDRLVILSNYYSKLKSESFASKYPSLAKEWHPSKNMNISPDMIPAHSGKKFWWKCAICELEWSASPDHRSRGRGCPKCKNREAQIKRRKSHESFIRDVESLNKDIVILSRYVNSRVPVKCQCTNCNLIFQLTPHDILSGRDCPSCTQKAKLQKIRKSQSSFDQEMATLHPTIKFFDPYINAKEPINCECQVCGFHWKTTPDRLHSGAGCPKCAGNARITHNDFIEQLKEKNPTVEVIGIYKNANTKVAYVCKCCGYIGEMKASHLKAGHSCPICARKRKNHKTS